MLMTITEYADYRKSNGLPGGSRQAVHKAIRENRILKEPCGKINSQKANRMWSDRTMLRMPRIG